MPSATATRKNSAKKVNSATKRAVQASLNAFNSTLKKKVKSFNPYEAPSPKVANALRAELERLLAGKKGGRRTRRR